MGDCPINASHRMLIKARGSFQPFVDLCAMHLRTSTAKAKEGTYTVTPLSYINRTRAELEAI